MNFLFPARAPKVPAATTLSIDGAPVEITVKVSPRARSYRLTVPHHGRPVLTLPRLVAGPRPRRSLPAIAAGWRRG